MPTIKVTFELKNLPTEREAADLFRKTEADAYVQIFKDNKILYTSETKENETNPKFKEAMFHVGVLDKVPGSRYLFKVFDKNEAAKDEIIGQVELRYPFSVEEGEHPLSTAGAGAGNARLVIKD